MGKIKLTEEDLQILSDCINNQTEIPEDLLLKLSPVFFDKLKQAGKFDFKERQTNPIDLPEDFQNSLAQYYTFDLLRPDTYSAWFNSLKKGTI